MEIDLSSLPSEELRTMYHKAYAELKKELLKGASWQDVKQLVDLSIGLSIELGKREYPVDGETLSDLNMQLKNGN